MSSTLAVLFVLWAVPALGFQIVSHDQQTRQRTKLFSATSSATDKVPLDCLNEAMHKMQVLQEDNGSPLENQPPIRIGPSSIPGAGSGVFATEDIESGTIIGFYPVHGIGLERFDTNAIATATEDDRQYFYAQSGFDDDDLYEDDDDDDMAEDVDGESDDAPIHNYLHYLIGARSLCGYQPAEQGGTLFIDINPNREVKDTWISHFVNDGAIVESNSEEGLLGYYKRSAELKNCVIIPFGPSPILATVTISKIKKGDELFTTYGGSYWLESLLQQIDMDDDQEEEEDTVEISDEVQLQANETAKDIFDATENSKVTHASLQTELEQLFASAI